MKTYISRDCFNTVSQWFQKFSSELKIIGFLLFGAILFIGPTPALAQGKLNKPWVELTINRQPHEDIHITLAKHHHSTLASQDYTVKIRNLTGKTLEISGTLKANLTNGGSKKQDFQVTIKPQMSRGGSSFITDTDGLSGAVFKEDCEGEKIQDPDDPKRSVINRIRTLTVENLRVVTVNKSK
jgi:hypothetical protein